MRMEIARAIGTGILFGGIWYLTVVFAFCM